MLHRRGAGRRLIIPFLLVGALLLASVAVARGRRADPDPVSVRPAITGESGAAPAPAQPASPPAAALQAQARRVSLTPLGTLDPGGTGFHGDVWSHAGYAYLGAWGTNGACPATGVKVIDIRDPSAPRWVATVAATPGTSQEDVVVRPIATAAFRGDLLAAGIQSCNGRVPGGLALFDVSDPAAPRELAFFPTGARGVHELDLIQQGDRALALLAVPDSERRGGDGDIRIVDVSDPRRPRQVAHWGAASALGLDPEGGIGCVPRTYGHSVRASADGRRAYLSYWDAGVVILDISDPVAPRALGRAAYPESEPGTTHSVAEAAGGRLLLSADEETVFETPPGLTLRLSGDGGSIDVDGCLARFSPELDRGGAIDAPLVDAGAGCGSPPAGVEGGVVLVDDGGACPLAGVISRLAAAGARAVLVARPGRASSGAGGSRAAIPAVIVGDADAARLREALRRGAGRLTLPVGRPWGGLRVWDIADPARPRQIAVFQTENSLRVPAPDGGYYTIHNPEVTGDFAVLAWWSDGVRVVELSDPARPREVASYLTAPARNAQRTAFPDGTMVWGVRIDGDLVLVSDVNSGLHILRLQVED